MVNHRNRFTTVLRHIVWAVVVALAVATLPVGAQSTLPGGTPDSFIELSTDKAELYVQEQLVLTVQLYFTNDLMEGELSEPVSNNAVIEPLGQQQEYARVRGEQRYRMIERRYAIYPQNPGLLSLAPIGFEGRFRSRDARSRVLKNSEQMFDVPVKDIPAAFSGDVWLPATDLQLEERGLPDDNRIASGTNLTRQLTLRASGLPSAALPPFDTSPIPGLRSYPEPATRSGDVSANGLTSMLQQTRALVPVQAGELQLPAIQIPWWDTASDSQKVAIIPARTLFVEAGAGSADQTPANPTPAIPAEHETKEDIEAVGTAAANTISTSPFWRWLALVFGVGWGVTALLFWRSWRKQLKTNEQADTASASDDSDLYKELLAAAGRNSADTPRLLLRWMNVQYPQKHFHSSRQIIDFLGNTQLETALEKLEYQHYGTATGAQPAPDEANAELHNIIRQLRRTTTGEATYSGFKPLYPREMNISQT